MREFEVMKILRDIDLTDKANSPAKHLSGGQKRKLSIGIAIIGDPKVVLIYKTKAISSVFHLFMFRLSFWTNPLPALIRFQGDTCGPCSKTEDTVKSYC